MALNINGTTGISGVDGSVSAPAVTGTDSNTGITFPSADTIKFSTGGVERISITNSGISGTGISSGGKFASYAVIADSKAYNGSGGTFTSGDWRTRDLNTEITDEDGIVSISSNQFTLQAGSYFLRASAPAYRVDQHIAKLQNITDATLTITGSVSMGSSSFASTTISLLSGRFTISGAKVFEIQHRCITTHSSHGFGITHSIGGFNSIYTLVEIFKES